MPRPRLLGLVAFAGTDGRSWLRVWLSDGTAEGTRRTGTLGSRVGAATVTDIHAAERLWFAADDARHGLEPWTRDIASARIGLVRRYGTGCAAVGTPTPRFLASRSTPSAARP